MSKEKISDEQLEDVNGGMEIRPIESPEAVKRLFPFIFNKKREQNGSTLQSSEEE